MGSPIQSHQYLDMNCSINLATHLVGPQGKWTQNTETPNMEDWWKGLGQGRWSQAGCKSPVTHPTPYGISQVEDKAGGSVQGNEDESIVDLCLIAQPWLYDGDQQRNKPRSQTGRNDTKS